MRLRSSLYLTVTVIVVLLSSACLLDTYDGPAPGSGANSLEGIPNVGPPTQGLAGPDAGQSGIEMVDPAAADAGQGPDGPANVALADVGADAEADADSDGDDDEPGEQACVVLGFDSASDGTLISAGTVVESAYAPNGILIDAFRGNDGSQAGLAVAFDTENPTGGDTDLSFADGQGNVLISQETFTPAEVTAGALGPGNEPDDNAGGAVFELGFDSPRCVQGLTVMDVDDDESPALIEFFAGAVLVDTVTAGPTGDGGRVNLSFGPQAGKCGVDFLRIIVDSSAAVDDIDICSDCEVNACGSCGELTDDSGTRVVVGDSCAPDTGDGPGDVDPNACLDFRWECTEEGEVECVPTCKSYLFFLGETTTGAHEVMAFPDEGGFPIQLTDKLAPEGGSLAHPLVAPDGTVVAVTVFDAQNQASINVLQSDGGSVSTIGDTSGFGHTWQTLGGLSVIHPTSPQCDGNLAVAGELERIPVTTPGSEDVVLSLGSFGRADAYPIYPALHPVSNDQLLVTARSCEPGRPDDLLRFQMDAGGVAMTLLNTFPWPVNPDPRVNWNDAVAVVWVYARQDSLFSGDLASPSNLLLVDSGVTLGPPVFRAGTLPLFGAGCTVASDCELRWYDIGSGVVTPVEDGLGDPVVVNPEDDFISWGMVPFAVDADHDEVGDGL